MNKIKKTFVCLLCSIMIISYGCQSIFALEAEEMYVEEQLEVIEDSIEVTDGLFDVEEFEETCESENINESLIEEQAGLLDIYNDYIDKGIISVTENGTIIINEDDHYYIEGGNVNKVTFNSSGLKIYRSKTQAVSFIKLCKTVSTVTAFCSNVAEICQMVSSYLKSLVKEIISFLVKTAFISISSLCKTIAKKATAANTGKYGIIVCLKLTGVSASKQTSSTT